MAKTLMHPLSRKSPGTEETGGEPTLNTWATASLIANVATGRDTAGSRTKATEFAQEIAKDSTSVSSSDLGQIVERAASDDAAMMQLIGILADGLNAKVGKAFNQQ